MRRLLLVAALVALFGAPARAEKAYTQQEDVVFGEVDGVGLLMDIFTPTCPKSGVAVVDIASGAWFSDRGKIRDHKEGQIFDIMCGRGAMVFAVRPGSMTRFSALEMVEHVKRGIRWVKTNADKYGVDVNRVVLCGASAGGHLTCLTAVTADDGQPDAKDAIDRQSCRVRGCVAFFPPTDFEKFLPMRFGLNFDKPETLRKAPLGGLLYPGGISFQSREEVLAQMTKISPAKLVTSQTPPILLIHGDADALVPLQQSKIMLQALKDAGVSSELIIKKGGGHPWPTIHEEVAVAADWMEKILASPSPATSAGGK